MAARSADKVVILMHNDSRYGSAQYGLDYRVDVGEHCAIAFIVVRILDKCMTIRLIIAMCW
jgi:hypothetical protein